MAKESGKKSFLDFFKVKDLDDDDEFDDDLFDDDDDDYEVSPKSPKQNFETVRKSRPDGPSDYNKSYAPNRQQTQTQTRKPSASTGKLVEFESRKPVRPNVVSRSDVYVIKPTTVEDTDTIVNYLLDGYAIVINLEGVELNTAQRIIDFVGGATAAIRGSINAISGNIFIAASAQTDVSGDLRDELAATAGSPQLAGY